MALVSWCRDCSSSSAGPSHTSEQSASEGQGCSTLGTTLPSPPRLLVEAKACCQQKGMGGSEQCLGNVVVREIFYCNERQNKGMWESSQWSFERLVLSSMNCCEQPQYMDQKVVHLRKACFLCRFGWETQL